MAELNHQKKRDPSYCNRQHKQRDSYDSMLYIDIWHLLINHVLVK